MSYPDTLQITYSYTGFQASQGNNSFPGTQIDADFANVEQFADQTAAFLAQIARADGVIKVSALPQAADFDAYMQTAITASETAVASANLAVEAAGAAVPAAATAVEAANSATAVLAASLTKAQNLNDLPDKTAARTNLGLTAFATKTALALTDFPAAVFTADADGRGKFADGFVDHTKIAAGAVVQVVNTTVSAVATTTTVLPADDTVPQSAEGGEFMTLAITPKSATNKLKIEVVIFGSHSVATGDWSAALFKDADAGALAAAMDRVDAVGVRQIAFTAYVTAGSTSAMTFKVRAGGAAAGTFTFNGTGGARRFGGVMASSITITEIKA